MGRALLAGVISLVCCAVPAATAATSPLPRAALESFVCQRATNPLDRAIEVTGVMRPLTGTQRMEMRFVLVQRSDSSGAWAPVAQGDLGHWRHPDPPTLGQRTSDVWRLKKLVVNLPGPADYRFRVTFRWLGGTGADLGRTMLFSPLCYQSQ